MHSSARALGQPLLTFPEHQQGMRKQVEQVELELVLMWEDVITGGGPTDCTKMSLVLECLGNVLMQTLSNTITIQMKMIWGYFTSLFHHFLGMKSLSFHFFGKYFSIFLAWLGIIYVCS